MKTALFFFLMIFSPFEVHALESPYLISGFDDVLRQAENTGLFRSALKILEADKTFAGMPELYRQMTASEKPPKFVIVSAISTWFDGRIESFLEQTEFPGHTKYLRDWLTEWSIEDFKLSRIKKIIAQRPDRSFIVIFDNSEASIALVERLRSLYPAKIKAIYLRQVVAKKVPQEATGFFTAFDIAIAEYSQQRLSLAAVKEVGTAVINETRKFMLIPPYSLCPKDYVPCPKETVATKEVCQLVQTHVRQLCQR